MLCEQKPATRSHKLYIPGKYCISSGIQRITPSIQVVMSLMKPLLKKVHCLIADNFCTSPQFPDLLLENQTDTYWTVKQNRKEMPPELMKIRNYHFSLR